MSRKIKTKPAVTKAGPLKGDKPPVLVLTLHKIRGEGHIKITSDNTARLTAHGFGMFLENVKPGEVRAGPGVIEALCEQPERRGLMGMDFWADHRIGFMQVMVPLNLISVPAGAKTWIRKFATA